MTLSELYSIFKNNNTICTDSRKITNNSLFFALTGENYNGNQFALDALNKGCSYAIIDDESYHNHDNTILVDNVLKTLQELAKEHRKNINIPIIGITGTNGKTTSKELIYNVLNTSYKTYATKGNLNNHIGVALSILEINSTHEIAIIEMGANHQQEINFLCNIANPTYGIITNIGSAHLEGFGDLKTIIKTKNELFQFIMKKKGHLFVNNDNTQLKELAKNINKTTYGKTGTINATILEKTPSITVEYNKKSIKSQLIGSYQFENILLAICVGEYFNVSFEDIKNSIEKYKPDNNRSQIIKTKKNTIILDAYNANPSSMEAMIHSFAEQSYKQKICIIGDMLELGKHSKKEHENIVRLCKELNLTTYFIGQEFKKIEREAFQDKKAFVNYIKNNSLKNKVILMKGSRGIALEKLVKFL